jgi:hypothetical protein
VKQVLSTGRKRGEGVLEWLMDGVYNHNVRKEGEDNQM